MNNDYRKILSAFTGLGMGSLVTLGLVFYYITEGARIIPAVMFSSFVGSAASASYILATMEDDN